MNRLPADLDLQMRRALFQYDLVPFQQAVFGNILQVETPRGQYALKRKKLTDRQVGNLLHIYQLTQMLAVDAISLLPSKYGDLVIDSDGHRYYLTPWINETVPASDLGQRYDSLYARAAHLHRQTLQRGDNAAELGQSIVNMLTAEKKDYEAFADEAEHRDYPSPLEQVFLRHAAKILGNYEAAIHFFSERIKNAESNAGGGIRRAICHGRLSPNHVLIDRERSFLINFDDARDDYFIIETAALFEQTNAIYSPSEAKWMELINIYTSICPLNEDEQPFLYYFLLCPKSLYHCTKRYRVAGERNEMTFTKKWVSLLFSYERLTRSLGRYFEAKRAEKEKAEASKKAAENQEDG